MIKLTCPTCKRFCGLMSENGKTGPYIEHCMEGRRCCPAVEMTKKWEPKKTPGYDIGRGSSGPLDEDRGGYQANARMILEDFETI